MEKKNPIAEAKRYVDNAKETIKKADYDSSTKSYEDKKYVRMAGNTLWNGCLVALEALLQIKKGKGRPSIEKYFEAAAKRDKKLVTYINNAYNSNHLYMGYDGVLNKKACDAGFDDAKALIDYCEKLVSSNQHFMQQVDRNQKSFQRKNYEEINCFMKTSFLNSFLKDINILSLQKVKIDIKETILNVEKAESLKEI